jgi:hypothetical protein
LNLSLLSPIGTLNWSIRRHHCRHRHRRRRRRRLGVGSLGVHDGVGVGVGVKGGGIKDFLFMK